MITAQRDMAEAQGLNANRWYEAKVVFNNDPDMLGRIQARVPVLFDGIEDADLPWAIPDFGHTDGASPTSGVFSVPKIGTKVQLRFQQANPMYPVYTGFHVDKQTRMEEVVHNYPDRAVVRFQNKAMLVVDTRDNIAYVRNPGTLKIYIDGNVEIEITGNVEELIHGNVTRKILGDLREEVEGSRRIHTKVDYIDATDGEVHRYSGDKTTIEAASTLVLEGSQIHENSGMQKGAPELPEPPDITEWEGIPGGSAGR